MKTRLVQIGGKLKQLTGIKSCDHGIHPLVKNDNLIFDDIEKSN
jgi:hypothetical protein